MKFSTECDGIKYIIEAIEGVETNPRMVFLLDSKQKRLLKKGKMKHFQVSITATKGENTLNFMLQGLPLNIDVERRMVELEDYFENQCVYSKIEHHFALDEREGKETLWDEK